MDKKARKPLKILTATPEDIEKAHQIVAEELGDGFRLDYETMPKNTGVVGDEGVRGNTVIISGRLANPAKFLAQNEELITDISERLWNETGAITKVLFEITPVAELPTKTAI